MSPLFTSNSAVRNNCGSAGQTDYTGRRWLAAIRTELNLSHPVFLKTALGYSEGGLPKLLEEKTHEQAQSCNVDPIMVCLKATCSSRHETFAANSS
jgi:hypothetical protein